MINWLLTWTMIAAIGTGIMALAIIITAFYAFKTITTTKKIEEQKYQLGINSILTILLNEINKNEVFLDDLIYFNNEVLNNINNFEKYEKGYEDAVQFIKKEAYNNLIKSGIGFKDKQLLLETNMVYSSFERVKIFIGLVDKLYKEIKLPKNDKKQFLETNISLFNVLLNSTKANLSFSFLYNKIQKEINYDFLNSKFYEKWKQISSIMKEYI